MIAEKTTPRFAFARHGLYIRAPATGASNAAFGDPARCWTPSGTGAEATVRFSGAISTAGDSRKTKRKSATMIAPSGKSAMGPDISFRRVPDRMEPSDRGSLREGRADNWQILPR